MALETWVAKLKKNISQEQKKEFTVDWFSDHIHNWNLWLSGHKDKPWLRFLEIGCLEGRSSLWLLENILTHPTSRLYCVDPFENLDSTMIEVRKRFNHNIQPHQNKVTVFKATSQKALRESADFVCPHFFDFIYIDGAHEPCHALEDAVLSFRLLKEWGILIFDDYELKLSDDPKKNPKIAIDAFLDCFEGQYHLIHKGWQVCLIKKISD